MKFRTFLTVSFLAFVLSLTGQKEGPRDKNDLGVIMLEFDYGFQIPAGELDETFGLNSMISAGVSYRFARSNWGLTGHIDYLFGRKVNSDVLESLRTSQGFIIGTDGLQADVFLRERGFHAHGGLTWNKDLLKGPDRLGLQFGLGGGYLTHWIRIQDDRQTADQLRGEYMKGYDRRRAGPSLHQFVGIQYLSFNKRLNFTIGLDLVQSWTKSLRPWDFATDQKLSGTQMDILSGVRFGWIIPFYISESTEYIYY